MSKKVLTLCLLHNDTQVLLGMKKRGFGAGRWNGFGGKVEAGETIEEGARREFLEEAGIEVPALEKVGLMDFEFEGNPEILEVHIFRAREHVGEPMESEEMLPKWFSLDEIPFSEMWPDDPHWMPLFFAGKKFQGKILFGAGDTILGMDIGEVSELA
ncbi:MAG: 8-oxo-dGTP diphosphatase [Candidatus Pacebacteria bacterium]|nr:8-oxo-dGTP diphosphatase [Candidatus Paceibacterota bacterium]